MKYGASEYYQGNKGKEYLAIQAQYGVGAALETAKFAKHIRPEDRVLDFGCGGGWVLANISCAARIGVELNDAAREFCTSNGVTVYREIDDVKEKELDVVISNHCLEHVPYPIEALRGLRSLLRPAGKLVLVVPVDDWRVQLDHTGRDYDHHLHTWTPRLLANTLVEAGFYVESVKVLSYAWPPGWKKLMNLLPRAVFDKLCWLMAVVRRRRQLVAVARNSPDASSK